MWDALDEGDFGAAIELAESCVRDNPESGAAWLGLAAARYETGDIPGTREAAERAGFEFDFKASGLIPLMTEPAVSGSIPLRTAPDTPCAERSITW